MLYLQTHGPMLSGADQCRFFVLALRLGDVEDEPTYTAPIIHKQDSYTRVNGMLRYLKCCEESSIFSIISAMYSYHSSRGGGLTLRCCSHRSSLYNAAVMGRILSSLLNSMTSHMELPAGPLLSLNPTCGKERLVNI